MFLGPSLSIQQLGDDKIGQDPLTLFKGVAILKQRGSGLEAHAFQFRNLRLRKIICLA